MPKFTPREKTIHDQFVQYGRNAKEWMRKCVLLLPRVAKHLIWQKKGFHSIYEYAAKLAGMNRWQVNEALRVLSKIEDKPELQRIVEVKGINAIKPIITIATKESAAFWAEKAEQMSKNTLEAYVRECKKENLFEGFPRKEFQITIENIEAVKSAELSQQHDIAKQVQDISGGEQGIPNAESKIVFHEVSEPKKPKKIVAMELETETAEQLEKLKGSGSWNDLVKQLLQMREEHLNEQKPEAVKTVSRHIPNKIKKYIDERSNGQCAFPCCIKAAKIYQHTQRWALENVHDPDRLYGLCKEHERIAHLGLIENEEQLPQNWKIRAQPDTNDPKYGIDLVVQKFRNTHRVGAGARAECAG